MTAIKVGDEVEAPGDLSRDTGVVLKLDPEGDYALVAFKIAGEMPVKRSRLHLVVSEDEVREAWYGGAKS